MIKLKLPRLDELPAERLPVELRAELERRNAPTPLLLLTRRAFLTGLAALLAVVSLPVTRAQRAYAAARGRFLTRRELETLGALCDRVIPPDADPGARALGAPKYIERLLASDFDRGTAFIFAGGPFSNRNPYPDNDTGTASKRRPRNAFRKPIPLTRLQELYWRAEYYGSASVPEVAALDAQFGGPLVGLRDIYRDGLAKVDARARAMFGSAFARLSTAQQDDLLALLDRDRVTFPTDPRRGATFLDLVIDHTIEGCFSAPEYGGNHKGLGWKMIGLEGDNQPLGYSIFSNAIDGYVERPDHPMSTPNPDEIGPGGAIVPRPLTPDGQRVQDVIVITATLLEDCPS